MTGPEMRQLALEIAINAHARPSNLIETAKEIERYLAGVGEKAEAATASTPRRTYHSYFNAGSAYSEASYAAPQHGGAWDVIKVERCASTGDAVSVERIPNSQARGAPKGR